MGLYVSGYQAPVACQKNIALRKGNKFSINQTVCGDSVDYLPPELGDEALLQNRLLKRLVQYIRHDHQL